MIQTTKTSMKPTQISWIGNIPENWEVKKLKFVFKYVTGGTPDSGKSAYYDENGLNWITISDLDGKYTGNSKNKLSELAVKEKNMKIVPKGSLLYSFKLSVGQMAFVSEDTYTNEAIFGILPKEGLNLDFWYYALGSYFISNANENIYGAKIFNQPTIDNGFLIVPPLITQTAIANFLDEKTEKITKLISNKKELIKLLKEQKQAIIHRAVTKGIDEKAKMKDSGIAWIGEIPEEWEVRKFKSITKILTCGLASTPEYVNQNDGIPFLSAQNVRPHKMDLSKYNFISKDLHKKLTKYRKPEQGDVLVTRVGAGIGEACTIDIDLDFSIYVSLTHIRPGKEILGDFIVYFFDTSYAKNLNIIGTIEAGGQGNLNVKNVEKYQIPLPPIESQKRILEFLNRETGKIDTAIAKIEKEITLIEEYRTSLIYQAVTGKIHIS